MPFNTAKDGSGNRYWALVDSSGRQILVGPVAHDGVGVGTPVEIGAIYRAADPGVADGDIVGLKVDADGRQQMLDDGGQEGTALSSALRAVTTQSADFTNPGAKGIRLTVDLTVRNTANLTLNVEYKDVASGKYETIFSAAAAIAAVSVVTYDVYPGDIVASDDVTEVGKLHLGRTWRINVTHSDGTDTTYSVGFCYLI